MCVRKQKILASMLAAYSIFILPIGGCAKIESASPENGYSTYYAMSAVEYNLFLTKEISNLENILMTRLAMAECITDGSYEVAKEIENTEESISKTDAIVEEITVTMPATNYESDRQNALDLAEDASVALSDYLDALNSGSEENIASCASQLKACYIALSGAANSDYE